MTRLWDEECGVPTRLTSSVIIPPPPTRLTSSVIIPPPPGLPTELTEEEIREAEQDLKAMWDYVHGKTTIPHPTPVFGPSNNSPTIPAKKRRGV